MVAGSNPALGVIINNIIINSSTLTILINKFIKASKGELDKNTLTNGLAKKILQHFIVDPASLSNKFFTDKYWRFLSDDEDVIYDLVMDFANETCEDDDEIDAIMEDPMWYQEDAIDWYCDELNATLIVQEDGVMVFVSNNLIDNEFVSEKRLTPNRKLKKVKVY